ncbi:hypothetical protein [Mesorhizobium sp. M7A.F.Ca.CA.004.02.1.1]|uniref:phage nozzle protein n=1 Tax=Mesorhizobium sp. M7A.F.Ca.CA.004.02.1.1 TaxID=2496690 RepID=UPI000FCBD637|nr:hypothetical protein [Mesorhizobium sp. M7A.F.Ca.CA.004.02.1.1]RVB05690.1 hypothetical protein EN912_02185 [Mesorhizobium sp. M7A.F.Ca.CA.004.02.1.1]
MAKISGTLPNFANGVSQQAVALRLASQGDFQLNAYSTVVDGLKKRPPTQRRASLGGGFTGPIHTHMINRDASERYEVIMSATGIRVFGLSDGIERTVNKPDGIGYLSYTGSPLKPPYRSVTNGDFTFITNSTKVTARNPAIIETVSPSEALVHVMAGNYGKDYKIMINGAVVAWYRTPDGTSANQSPAVDTAFVSRRLATGEAVALLKTVNDKENGDWEWKATDTSLAANGITTANGWTVKVMRGTIYIKKNNGTAFSIGVEDGYNGFAMKAVQTTVQDFTDLPAFCEEGMAINVTGSVGTEYDDYFVRFGKQSPSDPISTPGVWREIAKPGMSVAFDASTMPHVLVREANGTFTFRKSVWDQRKAGDENTCPSPSFVGKTINDVFFFKNRLGFLSEENVVMSRHGSYFNYWRATATALLDDDPIDVGAVESGVSILRSALSYADMLVMFADQMQFTLKGNEMLTPKTASIRPVTSYSASPTARPVQAGDVVFFPVDRGQFSMVREFNIDQNTGAASAEDITGHVPQYLPGAVTKMIATTHEDMLIAQCDGQPDTLFVYKYYWNDNKKLQASWSQWTFPGVDKVLDMGFIGSQLVLIFLRGDEAFLEVMDVQPGGVDDYATFVSHLDRRFRVDGVRGFDMFDPFANSTTVVLPFDISTGDYICVTAGSSGAALNPGLQIAILSKTPTSVVLRGDMRGVPLYFGVLYSMRYDLSTIYLREQAPGGGTNVITEGRLQLLQLLIQFSKTAYFKVEVTTMAGDVRTYITNGRLMGDPENRVDRIHLSDGNIRVPILSKNDRVKISIVNDSYLPCSLLSAEWVANYVPKSKRI